MARNFRRLTVKHREVISRLYYEGVKQIRIAQILGVHRSTVCRELKRNKFDNIGYIYLIAQEKNDKRRSNGYKNKIFRSSFLMDYVEDKLNLGWSPEQIAGRLNIGSTKPFISYETIYSYIFSQSGIEKKLYKLLKTRRKKRFPKIARKKNKRSLLPNRVSIHDRPQIVNTKEDFGHWKGDLIVFSTNKKANLFTMRERKSRYMIAIKNENRSPSTLNANLFNAEKLKYVLNIKSITFDNDIAFTKHELIAKNYSAKTYFCDPFESYQKGCIENGNRLLREYCVRKIDINNLC